MGEGEFFFWRRRKTEKEKEENIWRRSLQKLSRILRSLGFGLGLETFANFWRVSVSVWENLVSGRKSRFWFPKIWSRKKVLVSVSENLVQEKKYRYRFGQNFGIVIQRLKGMTAYSVDFKREVARGIGKASESDAFR